jgi:trigger factor
MKTVVEPLEGNKVKLSVEIDEQEFEKALDAAFRKIARDARIPGFRPGKAPRRLLEARMGKGVARGEALRESLPEYYAQAVRETEVDAIGRPEIEITSGEEDGPIVFDAVVDIRPQLKLAGYGGLRVTIPTPVLTDEEVQAQLDKLRSNFGELVTVERPARNGDHITIDLKVSREGEPDKDTSTEDFMYELGTGGVVPELDDHLQGASVGDSITFSIELPSDAGTANFEVQVKEIKEKLLPEVTDEWAGEASEFETVDELMTDMTKRLALIKRAQAQSALRSQVIEAVTELVTEEPPDALVNEEITHRAHELEGALKQQGATLGQYLTTTGRSQQQLVDELRAQSIHAVKADLALRAVAEAEDIEVTEDDIEAEIVRLADRFEATPDQVREQLESTEQMPAVRSDVRKGKAVEWLVDHTEAVDADGQPIDRALLENEPEAEATDVVNTEEAEAGDA